MEWLILKKELWRALTAFPYEHSDSWMANADFRLPRIPHKSTKYPVGKSLSSWEAFVSGTDSVGAYSQQTILPVKSYGRGWFHFHHGDHSA